jgi:hypothetical protein
MQHIISNQNIHLAGHNSYTADSSVSIGFIHRFIAWCDMQQGNNFMWLGVAFLCGIGTVLPITLSAIVFIGGNDLALWIIACIINVPILVVNLALQSTKITLPVLFFAWAIDLIIITYCLAHFFVK